MPRPMLARRERWRQRGRVCAFRFRPVAGSYNAGAPFRARRPQASSRMTSQRSRGADSPGPILARRPAGPALAGVGRARASNDSCRGGRFCLDRRLVFCQGRIGLLAPFRQLSGPARLLRSLIARRGRPAGGQTSPEVGSFAPANRSSRSKGGLWRPARGLWRRAGRLLTRANRSLRRANRPFRSKGQLLRRKGLSLRSEGDPSRSAGHSFRGANQL